MILVEEGHHNVADSWRKVFTRFPDAKVISLTATPFRSDGELRHDRQAKALRQAVEDEDRIIVRNNGTVALNCRTQARRGEFGRDSYQVAHGPPAGGKAEASPITLGLFSQAQVESGKIRAFNLKDLVLMNGRPCRAHIGFPSNHREEMKLPVTPILGNLGNATVQPQPNAHRGVLHCPRELKPSEAF